VIYDHVSAIQPTQKPIPSFDYADEGGLHTYRFPEAPLPDVCVTIEHPAYDPFGRLMATVTAHLGTLEANHAQINLLDQNKRVDFASVAATPDGQIDWHTYLLVVVPHLRKLLSEGHDGRESANGNPWQYIKDVPTFLAEPSPEFEGLAKDLLAPGAITMLAAPRALGKTHLGHALGVALATGGLFRGERVRAARVLLLDCDNPEYVVKQQLKSWGAEMAKNFHILTRQHAPSLKH